ncbi:MAG: hypothetical protein H0X62_01390 [Bacteroidetes bacterium]|nr:hypothetical protein [Bacteroidota bacterium]
MALASFAQPLTGTKTIPGDYPTFNSAITDLNLQGVGPGGIIFNITAGYVETGVAVNITASGTAASPIVFQKIGIGNNPKLISGQGLPGNNYDSIICITGGDWITFDSFDLEENIANTTVSAVEKAFYINRASSSNGCHNITIKNCNISLNYYNNSSGIFFSDKINATNFNGTNSNNKFFLNIISGCNI